MKDKILLLLKKTDGYISGELISQQLGISRSAVWKHIQKLRYDGYPIKSFTNKGYHLNSDTDLLNEAEILFGLSTKWLGKHVIYQNETTSTNNLARQHSTMPHGSLFVADDQTAGKGRLGRTWASTPSCGIWMSILLKPDISMQSISQLTLVAGLSVCKALREYCNIDAQIKWPNDIVVDDKKICGILTEMSAEIERLNYVICGIGVNVNHKIFDPTIADKATSVFLKNNRLTPRAKLIQAILKHMEGFYTSYITGGFVSIKDEYSASCATVGKQVRIIKDNEETIAFAESISDSGELVVSIDGVQTTVYSGEVSVHGLLGYV